jgi:hypothetical protein
MIKIASMLLIGSTAKKAGKTKLACDIIQLFSKAKNITAVKITPLDESSPTQDAFSLTEEKNAIANTDSSRFLKAGAKRAFWLKVKKDSLQKGFNALLKVIGPDSIIVCESTSLRKVVEPGLFLIVKRKQETNLKPSVADVINFADRSITFDGENFDINPDEIKLYGSKWSLRKEHPG